MRGEKFNREPCEKCSGTLFYVKNRKCVSCSLKLSATDRAKKREGKPPKSIGKPRGPKNQRQIYNDTYRNKNKPRVIIGEYKMVLGVKVQVNEVRV